MVDSDVYRLVVDGNAVVIGADVVVVVVVVVVDDKEDDASFANGFGGNTSSSMNHS